MSEQYNILNYILKNNLKSFIQKSFYTINHDTEFCHNWHIDLIADYLEAVRTGEIKRLIINMPPRTLKSICINVAWPAWLLGKTPNKRIITASYSQILSDKHSLDCKLIINSKWYKRIFPKTILSKLHNKKNKFLTTANGFRFATSVSGSITGEGGDFIIIDDPHNPAHIHSPKQRKKVIEWFEKVLISRLNNPIQGAIILVMQRLHYDDLSGYLSQFKEWEQLKLPIETNQTLTFYSKNNVYTFPANTNLINKRITTLELNNIKSSIGDENYKAQYLQNPILQHPKLLIQEKIQFYYNLPPVFEYYVQSWDTAITNKESSDYSVCSCFGVINQIYYLVDLFRAKLNYPDLKKEVHKLKYKYNPRYVLIENKASGQQLIQDLLADKITNIIICNPKFDKYIRFCSVIDEFYLGKILLPLINSSHNLIVEELINFPNSKHDDILDSITQFLIFMKNKFDKKVTPRIREL